MKVNFFSYLAYLIVMVAVTYATRALPLIFIRRKFKNRFFISVCTYLPYAVLAVMTVPAMMLSTNSILSGVIGFAVAVAMAYFVNNMMAVALAACGSVFAVEMILMVIKG